MYRTETTLSDAPGLDPVVSTLLWLGQPRVGDVIGRFTVVRALGSGGMSLVLLAYDPALRRHVALKLVRPDLRAGEGEQRAARLLREAQAMAQVAHPNVLGVHECGVSGDDAFVAMEHVDGMTLTAWLAAGRSWRDIVSAFAAAARGLHAVHLRGLVHRDFKPDNVFVAKDGRILVGDFGIVGTAAPPDDTGDDIRPLIDEAHLTGESTIMGTPGYIAPEHIAGDRVDARADQYAFCVALRAALMGRRAPRRIHKLIRRGLALDPAARHPSMQVLAEALVRRPLAPFLAVLVALVALAFALGALAVSRQPVHQSASSPSSGACR